jgi:hypothetical protein
VLYSLTRFLRQIHAKHLRTVRLPQRAVTISLLDGNDLQRVTRYMLIIWQAAIPPLLCATALLIKYIVFTKAQPVRRFEKSDIPLAAATLLRRTSD